MDGSFVSLFHKLEATLLNRIIVVGRSLNLNAIEGPSLTIHGMSRMQTKSMPCPNENRKTKSRIDQSQAHCLVLLGSPNGNFGIAFSP